LERFHELRPAMPPSKIPALEEYLRKLDELVSARADARIVKEVTEAAIPLAIEALDLRSFPRERRPRAGEPALHRDMHPVSRRARGRRWAPRKRARSAAG
jgi:hypothetical protein